MILDRAPIRYQIAKLSLPSWPSKIEYKRSCYQTGDPDTKVLLHESQGEIDACCYTGTGVKGTVLDKDRIVLYIDAWVLLRKLIAVLPMRRSFTSVKKSGRTEEKSAGAYGADTAGSSMSRTYPAENILLVRSHRTASANDQQSVDRLFESW